MAGDPDRVVYLHPGSDGRLTRICDVSLLERRVAWEPFAGRGVSDQLHALYPKLRPRVQRHPAQVQIGYEDAREALLGGRGKGAGAGGLQLWRRNATTGAASASSAALAAGSATAAPAAPGGHALAAAPALAHSVAAPSAAQLLGAVSDGGFWRPWTPARRGQGGAASSWRFIVRRSVAIGASSGGFCGGHRR